MAKLTQSQFDKVVLLLTEQFNGKTLAFGSKFGYNAHEIISCDMEFIKQRQIHYPDMNTTKLMTPNKRFRKSFVGLDIIQNIPTAYTEYYSFKKINIQRLKTQYSNGVDAVHVALNNL